MAGRPGRNNRSRRFRNTDGGDRNGRRVQSGFKDDDCYGVRDDQGNHRTNRGSPFSDEVRRVCGSLSSPWLVASWSQDRWEQECAAMARRVCAM